MCVFNNYTTPLLDIDECATANGNCDQDCHNTNGSYYCTCDSGWRLDPDGHACNGEFYTSWRKVVTPYHSL